MRPKALLAATALFVGLLMSACGVGSSARIYYGDSSEKYYRYVKNASEQSLTNYRRSLERVFERSQRWGIAVPPGLYADYAMLMFRLGETDLARQYILMEKETWPDSARFMDFVLQRYFSSRGSEG